MDNLIYSATPLRAFSGGFIVIAALLGLGAIGVLWAIFSRKDRAIARVGTGCASIFLVLVGIGVTISLIRTVQSGDKTVTVAVDDKKEVVSNCDTSGGTCTSYRLETKAGTKLYDFTVVKAAWDKAEVDACYQVTYYPSQSLFGKYLQEEDISEFYETSSTITRIEKVNCQ